MASISFPYTIHPSLAVTVHYRAGVIVRIWQMRKLRHRKTGQKDDSYLDLNLDHTANHAEKNLTFILRHLLRTSPKFASLFTPILPSHSGPAHSWGRRCWAPRSRGPAERCIPGHTALLSRAGLLSWGNMLLYKHRKPCTMCSGPSPEGLWWSSPIIPPHLTMPRGRRPHTHTQCQS